MKKPTISICIPTFNRADLLDQTLQSVANQTVRPFEVVVVDNASTDNTKAVVGKYKKFGIRYIRNKVNVGMVENWNVCVKQARGEYLSFLHSDDLIAPTWYEKWEQTITKHPAKFYTSSIIIIDQTNKPQYVCHTFKDNMLIKQPDVFKKFWQHLSPAIAPTAASIYHKSVFQEVGLFDPTYGTETDVVHFLEIFKKYNVYYLDQLLFAYRSHPAQGFDTTTQQKSLDRELLRLDNYFNILQKFYKKNFQASRENRFFIQIPLFMTLAPATLYLAKLNFAKVNGYYVTAKKRFPDLFLGPSDWYHFIKIQLWFVRRALFDRFISQKDREQIEWLENIKI